MSTSSSIHFLPTLSYRYETGTYLSLSTWQGATDYINSQHERIYFEGNTSASKGARFVTADGRDGDADPSIRTRHSASPLYTI